MDPEKLRKDFPIFQNRDIIYFDNAATTQKPRQVIEALVRFYSNHCANIHRGIHSLSMEATELYEESKKKVAEFIGARDWSEIVYVKNATEALNLVAQMIGRGKNTVITIMEHHSNMLPWMRVSKSVRVVDVTEDGQLDIADFERKVRGADVVAFVHASNVLGTVNPVKELTKIAHGEGALVVVDGAQSVPHMGIDVKKMDVDFLAFSGHKMLAPGGTGVLYGKRDLLEGLEPPMPGGGSIAEVRLDGVEWAELPYKFEGGTPNIGGAIALGAAVDYLSSIGMENIHRHESRLVKRFLELAEEFEFEIYGPKDPEKRTGLVAFNIPGIHAHDVADFLNSRNIAIRSGKHCTHPLHRRLGIVASARASFYLYNTLEEVERFFEAIEELLRVMG